MYKLKLTEMWRNVTHMGMLQFYDVKSLTSTLNRLWYLVAFSEHMAARRESWCVWGGSRVGSGEKNK